MSETLLLLILLLVLNISNLILKLSKRIKNCNMCCCKSDCLSQQEINQPNSNTDMNLQIQNIIQETLMQKIMRTITPRRNIQQANDIENPNT
jgi:hypothetical protein